MRMTLGVDFGGSSSKATLLGEDGRIYASARKEYPFNSPVSGWMEQDVDLLEAVLYENIREIIRVSGQAPSVIQAVAIDAATHMAVFCDENDRPVRPMIHWSDSRSSIEVQELKEKASDILSKYCVNAAGSSWTVPQIMWLNKHEPDVLRETKRIYFGKDYLRHLLTGDFCTDYIEAMGTLLSNDHTGEWEKELCALADVRMETLPEIKAPDEIAGYITADAARKTGLIEGTPVIIGSTDTVLEVLSAGAIREGDTTIKLATAGRICPITSSSINHPWFYNYKHVVPGMWYPGTATRSCAAAYSWYKNTFFKEEEKMAIQQGKSIYDMMNEAAAGTEPGADGIIFHPYLLGEMTPYADDSLCASFVGVKMHHKREHFTRAVMEGVSYAMRDCMEVIHSQDIHPKKLFAIGGGTKGTFWRQILSDVLGQKLYCVKEADSSLGSAMLAALSVGIFSNLDECVNICERTITEVVPNPENKKVYDKGFERYTMFQRAMHGVYRIIYEER